MQNIKVNGIEYDDSYMQKYYDALKVMDYFDAMKWIDFKMYVEYNQTQFSEPNKLMEVPIQFMSKLRFDLSQSLSSLNETKLRTVVLNQTQSFDDENKEFRNKLIV